MIGSNRTDSKPSHPIGCDHCDASASKGLIEVGQEPAEYHSIRSERSELSDKPRVLSIAAARRGEMRAGRPPGEEGRPVGAESRGSRHARSHRREHCSQGHSMRSPESWLHSSISGWCRTARSRAGRRRWGQPEPRGLRRSRPGPVPSRQEQQEQPGRSRRWRRCTERSGRRRPGRSG